MARKSTRKRERGDHSLEPNKREHSDNTEERYMEPTIQLEEMEEVRCRGLLRRFNSFASGRVRKCFEVCYGCSGEQF
jgi:hypothetical protein